MSLTPASPSPIPLRHRDLDLVTRHIPRDIRDLLKAYPGSLWLGGGFIRSVISGETPSDIDLFGTSPDFLRAIAEGLETKRGKSCRRHTTHNAITLLTPDRLPVQFITRWTFDSAAAVIASFDFTIAQALVCRDIDGRWFGMCSPEFHPDLAARRLVYTAPIRDEEAGGSLLRVLKFIRRGYVIQVPDLAGVVDRLLSAVDRARIAAAVGARGQ